MLPKERIKLASTSTTASLTGEKPDTLIESLKQFRPQQQQQQQHHETSKKATTSNMSTTEREKLLSQDGVLEAEKLSRQVNEAFKSGLLDLSSSKQQQDLLSSKTGNHSGLPSQISSEKVVQPVSKRIYQHQVKTTLTSTNKISLVSLQFIFFPLHLWAKKLM